MDDQSLLFIEGSLSDLQWVRTLGISARKLFPSHLSDIERSLYICIRSEYNNFLRLKDVIKPKAVVICLYIIIIFLRECFIILYYYYKRMRYNIKFYFEKLLKTNSFNESSSTISFKNLNFMHFWCFNCNVHD